MWKPGETGNAGGPPKTKLFSQALRNVLSLSEAETIAKRVVLMAKRGDLHAVNIIRPLGWQASSVPGYRR
jgi:hypothetical protein